MAKSADEVPESSDYRKGLVSRRLNRFSSAGHLSFASYRPGRPFLGEVACFSGAYYPVGSNAL
jgi:hypothetical protein